MILRHMDWFADAMPAHTVTVGFAQYVFADAARGLLDIRDKHDLEALLRHPSRAYELAYELYGVAWAEDGQQIDIAADAPAVIGRRMMLGSEEAIHECRKTRAPTDQDAASPSTETTGGATGEIEDEEDADDDEPTPDATSTAPRRPRAPSPPRKKTRQT